MLKTMLINGLSSPRILMGRLAHGPVPLPLPAYSRVLPDRFSVSNNVRGSLLEPTLSVERFEKMVQKRHENTTPQNKFTVMTELTEVLDQYLQNKWTDETQPEKRDLTLNALKKLMGKQGQGNMVMAQINPTAGDVQGNALKMMRYIRYAEAIGADTVIFPETSLMGYPVRDLITRYPALVDENMKWLNAIAAETRSTQVILGFIEPRIPRPGEKLIGRKFYNSLAILSQGRLQGVARKQLIPNYAEFNGWRTFEPSQAPGVQSPKTLGSAAWGFQQKAKLGQSAKIHNHRYGVSICEDTWNDHDFWINPLYRQDPIARIAKRKPEAFINISASPSRQGKEQLKHNMLSHIAQKYKTPYVYVNQVGAIDESSFDGASRVYDKRGNMVARAKSFQEQFMIVNPLKGQGKIYPLTEKMKQTYGVPKRFDPHDKSDLARTYHSLIQGIRDYFEKRGYTKRAVLGISGGLDSAVVATLLADALGPENVIGLRLSSKITSGDSEVDAMELGQNLGIHVVDIPIKGQVNTFERSLQKVKGQINQFWGQPQGKTTTNDNLQARARAMDIWALGNEWRAVPVATCDKSELYMGYTTIGGDMLGELSPIADLPKTKVRALAKWMNQHRLVKNAVPVRSITKPSGAELTPIKGTKKTVTAEQALLPYEFLDEIIWRFESLNQSKTDMLGESFWYERHHKLSMKDSAWLEQKKQFLDKFFRFDQISQIKRELSAPPILVSPQSISKREFHRPITAKALTWETSEPSQIKQLLQQVKFSARTRF